MEHKLWWELYHMVKLLDMLNPARTTATHPRHVIVGVYLWAVVHDRPVSWACQRENWPEQPPFVLPPQCTMSRRLRSPAVRALFDLASQALGEDPRGQWFKIVDGKPLTVGAHSKDRQARWGRVGKTFARGYRLLAIWGRSPLPLLWDVAPMNAGEPKAVRPLVQQLPGEGYLVGDKAYDSNPLHKLVAQQHHQLVAPPKRKGRGLGHRPHSPGRLRALELLEKPFGQALHQARDDIEREFGGLCTFGGGLAGLPAWVRGPRVSLWVHAKLLINAARIRINQLFHSENKPPPMLATA